MLGSPSNSSNKKQQKRTETSIPEEKKKTKTMILSSHLIRPHLKNKLSTSLRPKMLKIKQDQSHKVTQAL
jgi:hypothetical protein